MVEYDAKLGMDFVNEVGKWMRHCKETVFSSDPTVRIACEPYEKILEMGDRALPYIHQAVTLPEIRTFPIFGWSSAMRGIIGESQYEVPQELQGNVDGIGLYVKRWLEEHDETLEECLSTKFFRSDLKQNYKSIFDN